MPTNEELANDLSKLRKDMDSKFNMILDAVNKPKASFTPENAPVQSRPFSVTQPEPEVRPITEDQASAEGSNYILNPAYQIIFDEYFDPEDGFTGRLEGVYFTVIVPMKFSNTDDAWRALYKEDTRLKVLKHDRIEEDMRGWCKAVVRNLKYDRNVKLKV